jgi:hypothetical protein
MCLDKTVSPMNCPQNRLQQAESCPETKPIYYLPIQHDPSVSPDIKQAVNAKVKLAGRQEEVPEKQRASNDEAANKVNAQWSVAREITPAEEERRRMTSEWNAGEEFVVEEEIRVAMKGKEEVQDTKLLFQAYDEEKRNDENDFDDIWRKIVDAILEE